ncbi:MAG: type II toxin-antitoxin system Phd/YefM family antitoxin, partial [Deltaproteobacteria bacterium]|nr:type II toxin-antitoxin system Phd/YefM family antitoxin [Deltaproteobacteria bacterium]
MLTINASLSNIDFEPLTEVKAKLSEKISKTGESKRLLAITVNGKPKAMLIPYDLFLGWMELKTYPPRHLSLEE